MKQIFVNLKRFDAPRDAGGICPHEDPFFWIESVMRECAWLGLGQKGDLEVTFLLPEALIAPAKFALEKAPIEQTAGFRLGCQGVHREDVAPGGNFGAFTASRPASVMRAAGCEWAIIGHSEERKEKLDLLALYDPRIRDAGAQQAAARATVDGVIRQETRRALAAGLRALVCVGETAEERGTGALEAQHERVTAVLREQLLQSLPEPGEAREADLVIGYEPIWAIGPGKTPPGQEEIAFVAGAIQEIMKRHYGFAPRVVYGGGLKEENAAAVAAVAALSGGLVALTRFSGQIGFYPEELARIIEKYTARGDIE